MGSIDAKKLSAALKKATNIGLVEESFTLDGCDIVLRNLLPSEDSAAVFACEGKDGLEYMHSYQREQIARSIVEVGGFDLRDVDFIEDTEVDPKNPETTRAIKLERHAYLLKNVVSTWSSEALQIAYKKFSDAGMKADQKLRQGITFLLPDETDEERYRRLLLEAKELEIVLPDSLVDRTLSELGWVKQSTADEIKSAMSRADQLRREMEAKETAKVVHTPVVQEPLPPPPSPPQAPPLPRDPHKTFQEIVASKMQPKVEPPVEPEAKPALSRAQQNAALEASLGTFGEGISTLKGPNGEDIPVYRPVQGAVEVQKQAKVDTKLVIDAPPVSGINPRFKPPAR